MFSLPCTARTKQIILLAAALLGTAAQAAITVTPTTVAAGAVTLTLNSSSTGAGSLVLLRTGSCGTPAQTEAGQDSTGAAAYREGSLALAAGTDGRYTVRNLAQSQSYTVCATNGTDTDSASFSTPAMAAYASPTWQAVGSAGFSAGEAVFQSLAFAPDGTPYVAYQDQGNSNKTTVMRYNGSSWENVGSAGISADYGGTPSLAFAPDGTPYVAHYDGANDAKTTVMRYNGSTWEAVGSAGFSVGYAQYQSLAFAPDGTPYVAYNEVYTGESRVMRYNGSSWETVGSPVFYGVNSYSLAFAPDGTPYVACSGGKARVMRYIGSSWESVGDPTGFSAGTAQYQSLAFAPDGTPYVAYQDDAGFSYKTTVMRFNGSSWESVGDPTGFSAGTAQYQSLAFAPDGTPYVAYQDDAGFSYKTTVMRYNGSIWENVGSAGFSAGVAKYQSLAFAPDGTPYVAYRDEATSGKTTVMRLTGTSAAPTGLTAAPGNGSVTLSWTAPASNGGSAITGYTVTGAPSGSCTTTGALTCTVSGLTNGTAYTFTVTATNGAGTSPASPSTAATPQASVPGAPTGLTAAAGDSAVALSWTAPASNGGSAITGYTVTGSPSGSCTTTGALTCTVSGLTNGTAYSFTVTATNAAGTGAASASASATPQVWSQPGVALPGGGNAGVQVGAPPGCTVSGAQIGNSVPAGAPAGANFPLGVFSFTAAGAGCTNATLSVRVDYPAGSLSGLQPYKYGPATAGAAASWFPHGSVVGDSVIFSVTDNGVGDNNTQLGAIADPMAPVLLPAGPAGATSIPTLSEWGMIVLSLLAALVGVSSLRRRGMV